MGSRARQIADPPSGSIIEVDPIATCVRAIMAERTMWTGTASELLRLCAQSACDDISGGPAWAKNPRALAGRLRRAQTFLRTLGIEITFSREGRTGTRMSRVRSSAEDTVSTVSSVGAARNNGSGGDQAIFAGSENKHQDDADGADAKTIAVQ
jgi:hypothetical protein